MMILLACLRTVRLCNVLVKVTAVSLVIVVFNEMRGKQRQREFRCGSPFSNYRLTRVSSLGHRSTLIVDVLTSSREQYVSH